eukprot:CAMPEP_0181374562 /NCGR_PEP_ID=MMETSP1106-20121128/16101_1 /TAXON_ID=81844 /ORGANISM="Mantoniella antarctica, Strain SL-175" /LENGTH=354 /DNA_ID=CAMNT_0023492581 /DNA_START=242 /DNA_END=1303 /DNA_ORIENTATION=+
MRSASHNTERHGSDTTRGVRIGLGTHANLNLDSAGTQRTTSDGGGAGAIVRGGGTPAHEDGTGEEDYGAAIQAKEAARRQVDDDAASERAVVRMRRATAKIRIPTVPNDSDGHPCIATSNCTHWRDWIRMPQDVVLTQQRVRNFQNILKDTRGEDPLTSRQKFRVEVWDPRRQYNRALANKPMHVISIEATFLPLLPAEDLPRKKHETCAVVGNAGTMLHSGLGTYIDAHEAVIRINYAPTRKFELDVGTKTTYDLSNKENSGKLGDGAYQWRNSTLLLTEGHSAVVRKNAYRQLVSASLGRGDARDGGELPVSRRVRFLSMSLEVSMSRFTWFAIKAELEDRINRELQQGLQS